MDPQSPRPSHVLPGPKLGRAWPVLSFVALTCCQTLFGDFEVAEPQPQAVSGPTKCKTASTYQCDGVTLYVCVDVGQAPTQLLDCDPPLTCDAVSGRCSAEPDATTGGPGDTSVATTSTTGTGGASVQSDNSVANSGSVAQAGAPPESDECDPNVDDCCPDDPNKTGPGLCGCGVVDTPECAALRAALAHRYSFDTTGTTVVDTVAAQNGSVVNTQIPTPGSLELGGAESDQYVNLPNAMVSGLPNATIEAWLVWHGGDAWQRVFDFGSNDYGEDAQGTGQTYLFLTPSSSAGTLRAAFTASGPGAETIVEAAAPLPSEVETHVAVVVDADNDALSLYVDGTQQATTAFLGQLSMLDDVNNWLGRSQFEADPELGATLEEFRIYRAALTAPQVMASYRGGTNPAFFAF